MSGLSRFLKQNKKERKNYKLKVSRLFTDEKGNLMEWEFKPLTSKEVNRIRLDCTYEKPAKYGQTKHELNVNKYNTSLIVQSCVFPDLKSVELQDSYNVKNEFDLINAMLTDPGEYQDLVLKIQEMNHLLDNNLNEKIKEAKN